MKYLVLISFAFNFSLNAQRSDLPKNAKPGKCYKRCFNYNEIAKWKEINCSKINELKDTTSMDSIKKNKTKLIKYQLKLKKLGYDIDASGVIDNKTFIAHNKYLKILNKEKRKEERRQRKLGKKKIKM